MAEDPQKIATLIALEERLTFQQRQLDHLNDVVLQQQAELERHRRELAELAKVARGLLDRTGDDLPHEKPPHY